MIADENLNPGETRTFVENAFRDGAIPTTDAAITKILPPVSRFAKTITMRQRSKGCWTGLRLSSGVISGWPERARSLISSNRAASSCVSRPWFQPSWASVNLIFRLSGNPGSG
ncbi:MAG: hypothetical protein LBE06_06260 [Azoarcus sp.]|nr:hypothetical protein [Azoarcus sp.]